MAYNLVPITTNINQVGALITQAKSNGQYDGNESTFDGQITRVLDVDQKTAEGYITENANLVKGKAIKCKERITVISELAKKKSPTDEDVKLAQLSAATIAKYTDEIHKDNSDLNGALKSQYRGGWPDVARGFLHDKSKIAPYLAVRVKGINAGKQIPVLTNRCDQYKKQAKEFIKQIIQAQKSGNVEVAEFIKDCENIVAKMKKKKEKIEGLRLKSNGTTDFFLKTLKKKKDKDYVQGDYENGNNRINTIIANAKEACGIFKTMTIQFKGLEKRAKASGPGWKEPALKAVKAAKTEYASAEKTVKSFDSDAKECVKLLDKVKKKVG